MKHSDITPGMFLHITVDKADPKDPQEHPRLFVAYTFLNDNNILYFTDIWSSTPEYLDKYYTIDKDYPHIHYKYLGSYLTPEQQLAQSYPEYAI